MVSPDIETVKIATNRLINMVVAEFEDLDGTANTLENDLAQTDTPTQYLTLSCILGRPIKRFSLEQVRVYLDPTNAETYTLSLLRAADAVDIENESNRVFKSPALLADSVHYSFVPGGYAATAGYLLPTLVDLEEENKLYFGIDWTGAPGDTKGFIHIRGRLLH